MNNSALHILAGFHARLTAPGAHYGTWGGMTKDDAGVLDMPFMTYSDLARDFIKAAYANNWIDADLDWMAWSATPQAQALMADPDAIAAASQEDLVKLLTAQIRRDRFVEGGLWKDFECGLIHNIAQRACAIINKDAG